MADSLREMLLALYTRGDRMSLPVTLIDACQVSWEVSEEPRQSRTHVAESSRITSGRCPYLVKLQLQNYSDKASGCSANSSLAIGKCRCMI
jgi:hypothetical protein